jgi:hypothetical protein
VKFFAAFVVGAGFEALHHLLQCLTSAVPCTTATVYAQLFELRRFHWANIQAHQCNACAAATHQLPHTCEPVTMQVHRPCRRHLQLCTQLPWLLRVNRRAAACPASGRLRHRVHRCVSKLVDCNNR